MLHVSFLSGNETFFIFLLCYVMYICNTVLDGLNMLNLIYVCNGKQKDIPFNTPPYGVFDGAGTKFASVGNSSFQV